MIKNNNNKKMGINLSKKEKQTSTKLSSEPEAYTESNIFLEKIPSNNNRHISIYLIKNIFSYIDKKTLFKKDYLHLNKQLFSLFNLKAIQIKIDHNHEIGGSQWMDTVYCEFDLEQICKEKNVLKNTLKNAFFEIESKDQGWASVNESSSFVILRIVDKNVKSKVYKNRIIVKNFREQNYKKTKIDLKEILKDEFNDYMNDLKNKDSLLQIVGKADYPGWLCYIRKCNAEFNLLSIDH